MKKILIFVFILLSASFSTTVFADEIKVEVIAENLTIPWEIEFAKDGKIFFTERIGNLRVIENNILKQEPILKLDVSGGEGGLLGLALDPNFEENHYIYLYYTYSDFFSTYNKVVRYTESENELSEAFVLVDKIPGTSYHDGGRIKFGPDGMIYITTGDAGNSGLSQDLDSLAGKILRINSDGTIPDDNPYGNLVYSYGHRNPQGIDWNNEGFLVSSEHGPSGENFRFAHDEINVIKSGENYGWPYVIGDETDPKYQNPILHTGDDTWAPSGITFYNSDEISDWTGKLFIATLRGSHLRVLDLDVENNKILSNEIWFLNEYGRLRNVVEGPEGSLYLLTSNQDGRGSPAKNDDMGSFPKAKNAYPRCPSLAALPIL